MLGASCVHILIAKQILPFLIQFVSVCVCVCVWVCVYVCVLCVCVLDDQNQIDELSNQLCRVEKDRVDAHA